MANISSPQQQSVQSTSDNLSESLWLRIVRRITQNPLIQLLILIVSLAGSITDVVPKIYRLVLVAVVIASALSVAWTTLQVKTRQRLAAGLIEAPLTGIEAGMQVLRFCMITLGVLGACVFVCGVTGILILEPLRPATHHPANVLSFACGLAFWLPMLALLGRLSQRLGFTRREDTPSEAASGQLSTNEHPIVVSWVISGAIALVWLGIPLGIVMFMLGGIALALASFLGWLHVIPDSETDRLALLVFGIEFLTLAVISTWALFRWQGRPRA